MKARPTQTRERVKGGTSSLFVCPLQGQGTASLVGFGATPQQFHGRPASKRTQQRRRQRSVPASNFARPQTRPQAALPPRFREEPKSESKNPAGQAAQFRFQPGIFMHLVEVNPLILARTEAKFRRAFDGVDAVAALDALQHVFLPRVVRRGVHHVHAGLVDGNRVE